MDAKSIAHHLTESVHMFRDVAVVGPGVAYHYTIHADAIERFGRFLGAPLNADLDQTQDPNAPNVAMIDPGVVFAYEDLAEAAEEGDGARFVYPQAAPEVFEIEYSAATRATHVQEASLDASPTLLISSAEIISFKRLGPCFDHFEY